MPGVLGKSAVAGVRKRQRFLWLCLWTSVVIPSMPRCGSHRISSGPLSKNFAQAAFAPGGTIHSDGYGSYIPALEGYTHEHKLYDPNSGLLHWLHIVISNAKAFILGTYHGLPKKYLQACLDEYCFRFSRRDFGPRLLERLVLAVGASARLSKRITT